MRAVASRPLRVFALFGLLSTFALAGSAGCNKDEPKKIPKEENKATPVPSDMVFNDFLPQGNSGAPGLAVRVDGGVLEAGAPSESGSAGGTPAAEAAAPSKIKVTEPGAEPRVVRKYAFIANKVDKRVLTLRQSMAAQGQVQEQPAVQVTVEFVPKDVKPTGAHLEVKLVKADLADKEKVDPRMVQAAAQQLGAFAGLKATFDVTPQGDVGELSMSGDAKMQGEAAADVLGMLSQCAELAFAPLPDVPVGVGAKWEREDSVKDKGAEEISKRAFEFKELAAEGGTIVSTMEKKVPKRPYPDPRVRGATMEVHATGSYTYVLKFDHVASKVTGEQTQDIKVELPPQEGNPQRQSMVQQMKVKHTLDTPK